MALGTFPEFTGWWEAGKIQSQTDKDLLHDVVDSMAVFSGVGEFGGPSGKSKNMSYQATEGPGCPGSRKKSCYLGLWAGTRLKILNRRRRILQFRISSPGESGALCGGWVKVWGHTDASVYHQRVGTAHRCKGDACSFSLCVLYLWKKVNTQSIGKISTC